MYTIYTVQQAKIKEDIIEKQVFMTHPTKYQHISQLQIAKCVNLDNLEYF